MPHRHLLVALLVAVSTPVCLQAQVQLSNTARFGILNDPNNPFDTEPDPNAQSALYTERFLLNFPELRPFNLVEELERELNANTPQPPAFEAYRQQSRLVSNSLFEASIGNVNGDLDAIPDDFREDRIYGTGPGDPNSFDEAGGSVGGFAGKLVSGIRTPAGSVSSNDQEVRTRIKVQNTGPTESSSALALDLRLKSLFEAQPNVWANEAVSINLFDVDEGEGLLPGSQRSSELYDTVPGGFGSPSFGTLFSEDEFSFPESNEVSRTASGEFGIDFTLEPGQEKTLEFVLTFYTQVSNGSEFPAQLDNTQSLDFALNIFGDGIEVEYLPAPEPASLALLVLGTTLVVRRRRA